MVWKNRRRGKAATTFSKYPDHVGRKNRHSRLGIYVIEPPGGFSQFPAPRRMHEIAAATLHFDPPFPGLIGGTILHGWLVPKPGHHFTELRARSAGWSFPGVFGIPRRDLAEFFKSDRPGLLAGFMITLNLPAGRHRLLVEGLTLAGQWERLDEIDREVTDREAMPAPADQAPLDAHAFGEIVSMLLHRASVTPGKLRNEAAALLEATPDRHHLQHPPRPFHGHLDQPRIWSRAVFGRVPVTGWIYHESLPIRRVFATTDLLAVQDLKFGRETTFLAGRAPASVQLSCCGYDGFLDLPAQLPLPVTVRVYAELEDGSWHLGSVARFAATDQEFAKRAPISFSPVAFICAFGAAASAARARGWPVPWTEGLASVMGRTWRDYAAAAPRHRGRPSRRNAKTLRGSGRIHLFTHNLSHEGAPLFLLEYADFLRRETGAALAVTSGRDGPLRARFEALGANVVIVDLTPLLAARDNRELAAALAGLAGQIDLTPDALVVANTLSTYWAVLLAHQARRPSLFYVHESTTPRAFFRGTLSGSALAAAESAFALADRVSFLTASTQRYYAGLADGSHYRLNPGWIDLAAIGRFRSQYPRDELRARLGVPAGRKLVINVGTVCERKGQHMFARAVEWLWQSTPALAAQCDFLMIGGRDTPYDRELADFIAGLRRPNLRIVPETKDVYPYYGAADVFACSSYEESFPRVVLEAMAFNLPIVSTGVHGIPDMVRDGQEALLVPPGDFFALAGALKRVLLSESVARQIAALARERVVEFDSRVLLPRHLALARELMSVTVEREAGAISP